MVSMIYFGNMSLTPYLGGMTPLRLRLRDVRKDRGLTQVQLAALTGLNQGDISRIESGQRQNVSLATLDRLCAALGCPVDELVEQTE